jgi:hypothetical protein
MLLYAYKDLEEIHKLLKAGVIVTSIAIGLKLRKK